MRKNTLLLLMMIISNFQVFTQNKFCGSVLDLETMKTNTQLYQKFLSIENRTEQFKESSMKLNSNEELTIIIPVVVHVLHHGEVIGSGLNISDAQINSQVSVLNEDFRRLNRDRMNTPSVFQSIAADVKIEFRLARFDTIGNPSTGIERRQTSTIVSSDDDVNTRNRLTKFTSNGGLNAWDPMRYLNIWIRDISYGDRGQLLGYAQFPFQFEDSPNTDGVVIYYRAFGRGNYNFYENSNLGRTTTHEVGHWLNLFHIWGDDDNNNGVCTTNECSGTDNVSDTPNQGERNYGCPTFPKTDCCTTTSPGVMFMNYMDYTDDACMNIFTTGQKARMRALFESGGVRESIKTSGQMMFAEISGPTTICSGPTYTYTIANLPQGATVQWSASNNSMTLNAPSNSATAIFRQTGFTNCEIRAAISFNGTVIANVALPVTICQLSISGPSTVCEQGTFTIDNLPQGATVQWSASNNNLTLISGQGTGTAVFQKAIYMTGGTLCTVKAKITFTSAGVNQTFSKEVTVSGPDPSKISISLFGANNSALCLNYPNDLVAGYNNTDSPEYDNIQEYEWHISDGWVLAYNHPANMDGIYPTNFIARARSISGNSSSPVYVSVRARNNCGWGPWSISTAFSTTNCSGSGYFSISPNPAPAGLVTINIQNETKTARNATSQSKTPYTIQLWNSLGIVKQIVTDQKSYQMDLSGVPAGFYYVHVIKDGKTYRKQLIVK